MIDDPYIHLTVLVEKQGAELNQFQLDVRPTASDADFDKLWMIVAHLMGNGRYEAFGEIVAERPDLKPSWFGQ